MLKEELTSINCKLLQKIEEEGILPNSMRPELPYSKVIQRCHKNTATNGLINRDAKRLNILAK